MIRIKRLRGQYGYGVNRKRSNLLLKTANLSPTTLVLVTGATILVSAGLAALLVWLLGFSSEWVVWIGLSASIASLVLTAFIFVWTANATARRDVKISNEVLEIILSHTNLANRQVNDAELDAIAAARGFGEGREAVRGAVRGVWGIAAKGRAARLYLIDGPDILFVRNTAARFNTKGGIEATRVPTDRWLR